MLKAQYRNKGGDHVDRVYRWNCIVAGKTKGENGKPCSNEYPYTAAVDISVFCIIVKCINDRSTTGGANKTRPIC